MHSRRAALLFVSALCIGASAVAEPRCLDEARVCLDVQEQAGVVVFRVANREEAPYTVRVQVPERSNLDPRSSLPFRAVIEPGEQRVVGVLAARDPRQPTRYELRWSAALGDARAQHAADVRYRMPFGGRQPGSLLAGVRAPRAREDGSEYALDFAVPFGTPVLAARAGRVVRVVDGYGAAGLRTSPKDSVNRVELMHPDGTIASYSPLRRGVAVQVGQQVATGQPLGFSSGDRGAARLRFAVWRRQVDLSAVGVALRFHDGSAQGFVPVQGVAYAPACSASGAGCTPGELPPVSEPVPAARREAKPARALRREDGACLCANGAVIHVELSCALVCGGR